MLPARVTDWARSPPESPAPGQIHIWRFPLAEKISDATLLPQQERQRLQRITHAGRRQSWLNSRFVLRTLLGRYLGFAPQTLEFAVTARGKPCLPGDPLHFNLSHSGQWGLLAIAGSFPLGVDLERFRPVHDPLRIAERMFPPEAQAMLASCQPGEREARFFEQWTLMEARQKLSGEGIFGSAFPPEQSHAYSFLPDEGYAAAVAWPGEAGPSIEPVFFQFVPGKR